MTDADFKMLWDYAADYSDKGEFIDTYRETMGKAISDRSVRVQFMGQVWDVAHMPVKELIAASGYSLAQFSVHFCVERLAVQGWCNGSRPLPRYARLMMARMAGLLPDRWDEMNGEAK